MNIEVSASFYDFLLLSILIPTFLCTIYSTIYLFRIGKFVKTQIEFCTATEEEVSSTTNTENPKTQ